MDYRYMTFQNLPKQLKASHKHYDVGKIIIEYSDYEDLKHDYFYYKAQILDLDIKCSQLQGRENYYTQRLSLIDNLQGMGFGFKDLKIALAYNCRNI
jgi:hypothetical protein